jgi:L-lactate dehydrogenase complex protein LldE
MPEGRCVEVELFIPCYVDQLAPSVGLATVAVLEHAGCSVRYDPSQTCCGQPFVNSGAFAEARQLGERHLGRFGKAEAIVCPSGSCVATVRRRYADLGLAETRTVREVIARTYELSEFLVHVLHRTDLGARFPHRVALLQSCQGLRELSLGTPSEGVGPADPSHGPTEEVLRGVSDLEIVFPDPPDECCGFGGIFSVQFPEVSVRMGRARLEALERTGAAYVTGTDTSCLLHLDGIRRRCGFGPRTVHLAEILARGIAA